MTLELHNLHPAPGAKRTRKRVGRGPGSGNGKTAGRGHKGQKSRSGYSRRYGFEGGQMPLVRRIPKRGFTNLFRVEYQVVNVEDLERLFEAGDEISAEMLVAKGLVRPKQLVKILGMGELKKSLVVHAHKFSGSARSKIEAASGRCEVVTS